MPAQSAAARPSPSASVLPCSDPRFNSRPITGNCASAELTIDCCEVVVAVQQEAEQVVRTSRSGKSEKKP